MSCAACARPARFREADGARLFCGNSCYELIQGGPLDAFFRSQIFDPKIARRVLLGWSIEQVIAYLVEAEPDVRQKILETVTWTFGPKDDDEFRQINLPEPMDADIAEAIFRYKKYGLLDIAERIVAFSDEALERIAPYLHAERTLLKELTEAEVQDANAKADVAAKRVRRMLLLQQMIPHFIRAGMVELVRRFLQRGALPPQDQCMGFAIESGSDEMLALFVGADVQQVDFRPEVVALMTPDMAEVIARSHPRPAAFAEEIVLRSAMCGNVPLVTWCIKRIPPQVANKVAYNCISLDNLAVFEAFLPIIYLRPTGMMGACEAAIRSHAGRIVRYMAGRLGAATVKAAVLRNQESFENVAFMKFIGPTLGFTWSDFSDSDHLFYMMSRDYVAETLLDSIKPDEPISAAVIGAAIRFGQQGFVRRVMEMTGFKRVSLGDRNGRFVCIAAEANQIDILRALLGHQEVFPAAAAQLALDSGAMTSPEVLQTLLGVRGVRITERAIRHAVRIGAYVLRQLLPKYEGNLPADVLNIALAEKEDVEAASLLMQRGAETTHDHIRRFVSLGPSVEVCDAIAPFLNQGKLLVACRMAMDAKKADALRVFLKYITDKPKIIELADFAKLFDLEMREMIDRHARAHGISTFSEWERALLRGDAAAAAVMIKRGEETTVADFDMAITSDSEELVALLIASSDQEPEYSMLVSAVRNSTRRGGGALRALLATRKGKLLFKEAVLGRFHRSGVEDFEDIVSSRHPRDDQLNYPAAKAIVDHEILLHVIKIVEQGNETERDLELVRRRATPQMLRQVVENGNQDVLIHFLELTIDRYRPNEAIGAALQMNVRNEWLVRLLTMFDDPEVRKIIVRARPEMRWIESVKNFRDSRTILKSMVKEASAELIKSVYKMLLIWPSGADELDPAVKWEIIAERPELIWTMFSPLGVPDINWILRIIDWSTAPPPEKLVPFLKKLFMAADENEAQTLLANEQFRAHFTAEAAREVIQEMPELEDALEAFAREKEGASAAKRTRLRAKVH